MSRELIQIKRCDLCKAPDPEETLEIAFEGVKYELDACTEHAAGLRETLQPYLAAAFSRKRIKASGGSGVPASIRAENKRIRAWARDNGRPIGSTGQIPEDIRAAYIEEQALIAKATKRAAAPRRQPLPANGDGGHTPGNIAKELAVPDARDRAAMRAWAERNGKHCPTKGLIPREVQDGYRADQNSGLALNGAATST